MKRLVVVAAALLVSASAAAGEFRFSYSHKEFRSPEQMERLHTRLQHEAKRYCQARYMTLNVRGVTECSQTVIDEAVSNIGNQQLAAWRAERSKRRG